MSTWEGAGCLTGSPASACSAPCPGLCRDPHASPTYCIAKQTSPPPPACPGAEFELDERGGGSATGEQVLDRLSFGPPASIRKTLAAQGRCAAGGVWQRAWASLHTEGWSESQATTPVRWMAHTRPCNHCPLPLQDRAGVLVVCLPHPAPQAAAVPAAGGTQGRLSRAQLVVCRCRRS